MEEKGFILLTEFELTFPLSLSVFVGSNCQFHVNFIYIRNFLLKIITLYNYRRLPGAGLAALGKQRELPYSCRDFDCQDTDRGRLLFTGDDKNRN